jgi:hypothetical protein
VATRTLTFVTTTLRAHRRWLGTRWRLPSSGRQTLMVLAHLRKGETYRDLGGRVWRRHDDRLPVPARGAQGARRIGAHPQGGDESGGAQGVRHLDGTLLRIDRVATASKNDRQYCSAKHKGARVTVQVIADPDGPLTWTSPALPDSRHDDGAAKEHGIPVPVVAARTGPGPGTPVRCAVMNANTSAATTSAGCLSTTLKKTFKSYAVASTVFGRHRPDRNTR